MRNLRLGEDRQPDFRGPRPRKRILVPALGLLLTAGALYAALKVKPLNSERPGMAIDTLLPLPSATPVVAPPPSQTHTSTPKAKGQAAEAVRIAPTPAAAQEASKPRVRTHRVTSGDSLAGLFSAWGLEPALLYRIIHNDRAAKGLAHIRPGQRIELTEDPSGEFRALTLVMDPIRSLQVERKGKGFVTRLLERPLTTRTDQAVGVIQSSLFDAAKEAGLSDALTMRLIKIFGWDIDFAREIRAGDRFSVIYQEQLLDGTPYADGPILAAEFINRGRHFRAIRFEDAEGHADYYTPDGKALRKPFLLTPVKYSRISSRFSLKRWHPILKRWRSHKGVDYAAAEGTPVKAAGKGRVTFIGRKGGYGNVIFIKHAGDRTTVYGHLSRFARGLHKGDYVKQGQIIGRVGHTGLATGPHLHFEFRIHGVHRDPLKVKRLPAKPIPRRYRKRFLAQAEPLVERLERLDRTQVADARQDRGR